MGGSGAGLGMDGGSSAVGTVRLARWTKAPNAAPTCSKIDTEPCTATEVSGIVTSAACAVAARPSAKVVASCRVKVRTSMCEPPAIGSVASGEQGRDDAVARQVAHSGN
jgi:hypothetical protein